MRLKLALVARGGSLRGAMPRAAGCGLKTQHRCRELPAVRVDSTRRSTTTPWGAGGAGLLQRFHGGGSDGRQRKVAASCCRAWLKQTQRETARCSSCTTCCLSLGLHGRACRVRRCSPECRRASLGGPAQAVSTRPCHHLPVHAPGPLKGVAQRRVCRRANLAAERRRLALWCDSRCSALLATEVV